MRGVTGPREVFEGNKGFMESIAGPFAIDWSREDLERVTRTFLKRYNAETHAQSALEGILELKQERGLEAAAVRQVEVEIFDVAYHIIGGGEEGDKTVVRTKEEADHSLPYLAAVAILDGQVMPEQYAPERIQRADVQALLRKIVVRPLQSFSDRFPDEMPCRITLFLPPTNPWAATLLGTSIFAFVALTNAVLCESLRRARDAAEHAQQTARGQAE